MDLGRIIGIKEDKRYGVKGVVNEIKRSLGNRAVTNITPAVVSFTLAMTWNRMDNSVNFNIWN
jgi:hypothetical protein